MTSGSAADASPRSNAAAISAAVACALFTPSIDACSRSAKLAPPAVSAAAGDCVAVAARRCISARRRVVSIPLIAFASSSDPVARHLDAGRAQLRQLVAQGSAADAELLSRLLAAAACLGERMDDPPRFFFPQLSRKP